MSLVCHENGRTLMHPEKIYAVANPDGSFFASISKEIFRRVPKVQKLAVSTVPPNMRVDVHVLHATIHPITGWYCWSDMYLGKFLFTVSLKTAKQYFPKFLKEMLELLSS